jgi:hypothetical protein
MFTPTTVYMCKLRYNTSYRLRYNASYDVYAVRAQHVSTLQISSQSLHLVVVGMTHFSSLSQTTSLKSPQTSILYPRSPDYHHTLG